jgi:hypothetical protein
LSLCWNRRSMWCTFISTGIFDQRMEECFTRYRTNTLSLSLGFSDIFHLQRFWGHAEHKWQNT